MKEQADSTPGIIVTTTILLVVAAILGLFLRWQNIKSDSYAECLKSQNALIELQRQHPNQEYIDISGCYL